jgi:hypothetical protein
MLSAAALQPHLLNAPCGLERMMRLDVIQAVAIQDVGDRAS